MKASNRTLFLTVTLLLLVSVLVPPANAVTPGAPYGHITIHRFPFGVPTILDLPPSLLGWNCTKIVGAPPATPAVIGDTLPNSGDSVSCVPPVTPLVSDFCLLISVLGYAATLDPNVVVTVTASCGPPPFSVNASFQQPVLANSASGLGTAPFPFTCSPSWTAMAELDDWWVHCMVN